MPILWIYFWIVLISFSFFKWAYPGLFLLIFVFSTWRNSKSIDGVLGTQTWGSVDDRRRRIQWAMAAPPTFLLLVQL